MAVNDRFLRGSEWRKWDLHFHTKGTNKNDQFVSPDFDSFSTILFKKAIANNISAFGITDYFSIDNYKKTIAFVDQIDNNSSFNQKEREIIKDIFILPNVELRMLPVTDYGRLINIHCIFNPLFLPSIENDFFSSIEYSAGSGTKFKMNKQGIIDLGKSLEEGLDNENAFKRGLNSYIVSHGQLQTLLDENSKFRENVIIAVSNSNRDGASGMQKHFDLFEDDAESNLDAVRKSIYIISDCIFSGNENDVNYFLGRKKDDKETVIRKCGSIKPCIHGSDAHTEEELFKPDLDRCCWIKADLTFEGLKQICYEPEERIKIQQTNPGLNFQKSIFTEIEIKKPIRVFQGENLEFDKCSFPLNQNLVTIIGGRGTGKSVLINYLANGFKLFRKQINDSEFSLTSDFNTKWRKTQISSDLTFAFDKQYDLEFLFISQSEVKEKVKDHKSLGNEIKKILDLENLTFSLKTDEIIQQYKSDHYHNLLWFDKRDENNNPINTREFIQNEIDKNKNLLERITTDENKVKLEKYSANIEKLQSNENESIKLNELKTNLTEFQISTNVIIEKIRKEIPTIDFKLQIETIDKVITEIIYTCETAQKENSTIKEEFKDYKGDLTSLLSNVERFSNTISTFERRLIEITDKEKQLTSSLENKKKSGELIKNELINHKQTIDNNWSKLLQGKEGWSEKQKVLMKKILNNRGISIIGEIVFDKIKFYDLIKEQIDGRSFKGKNNYNELEELLGIKDFESYIVFINDISNSTEKVSYYLRSGLSEFENIFYELRTRSSYLYAQPKITLDEKPLEKLSVGQRGTIYLCLKLATNIFSQTIIFDQPEDDLDNSFIFSDLLDIFKEIKQFRQVIIVTHNANLVVNADAEQVIVAKNEGEKLSYNSGSLENPVINKEVCDILEGGKIAFQQRRNKYQLK
jgi:hypothetical protein